MTVGKWKMKDDNFSEIVAQAGRGCAAPAIDESGNSATSARLRYSRRPFSLFNGVAMPNEGSSEYFPKRL